MSAPTLSKTFHDVTPSIPGAWKQAVPGFKDPGSVNMTMLFNYAFGSHGLLLKSYRDDVEEQFRIVYPERDAAGDYEAVELSLTAGGIPEQSVKRWDFNGFVSSISTSHAAGGIIVGNVTLKLSGKSIY